jgi:hypothetical protein
MAPETADAVIAVFLKELTRLLDEAAKIAKAAEACAKAGSLKQAVEIAMDIEPLTNDANQMLGAALGVNRLRQS